MSTARPILFSAPMIRALLEGRKTQTRRVVKPQPLADQQHSWRCPYGQPSDLIWVRETWDFRPWSTPENPNAVLIVYGADAEQRDATAPDGWNPVIYNYERWRPSIFMPRWASRFTLRITDVRAERLQDISDADAIAEGCPAVSLYDLDCDSTPPARHFRSLWESINGPGSWDGNPWCWCIQFECIRKNVDEVLHAS